MKLRNLVVTAVLCAVVALGLTATAEAGTSSTKTEWITGCNLSSSIDVAGDLRVVITGRYWGCYNPGYAHRIQVSAHGWYPGGPEEFDLGWTAGYYNSSLSTSATNDYRSVLLSCRYGETVRVDAHIQTVSPTGKIGTSGTVSTTIKCVHVGSSGSW